jgi:hypothetical protein
MESGKNGARYFNSKKGHDNVVALVLRWAMPRALSCQYPGAVYHLLARGDGGKAGFEMDEDWKGLLFRLTPFTDAKTKPAARYLAFGVFMGMLLSR